MIEEYVRCFSQGAFIDIFDNPCWNCPFNEKCGSYSKEKYRIDIYSSDNPDLLLNRVYKGFENAEAANNYADSIANGNIPIVNRVKEV